MFLVFIPIFFRVIHHSKIQQFARNNIQAKDITRCESLNGNRYTNNNYNNYLINCEVAGTSFGFYGTTFSGHTTTTGEHMLHIINVNFDVHNCPFTNCGFLSAMIYCHGIEYAFSMQGNTVTNCNNKNNPISNSNIVDCDCQTTKIQDNTITFTDTSNSCRAFFLANSRNTKFTNNKITNSNVGSENSGSGLSITKSGTGTPIEFSRCTFTSCKGGNGAIISIGDIDYSIEINEMTIEKTKNELNNGFGYLILLNCNNMYVNPEAKFTQCRFSYLESDASSGGSIGLWFKGNKLNMSLIFERSTFENLKYLRPGIGGAITFIKENSNKATHLTIDSCDFDNCTSSGSGSAICYCAPSQQLTITGSNFRRNRCTNSGGFGGAIFVEYQEDTLPVVIQNCVFEDVTSNDCKGNAIVLTQNNNNVFHYATIEYCSFLDCGLSGYVIYYTIGFVLSSSTTFRFSSTSHSCGGIHKDANPNLPSQIILNALSKSGDENKYTLKIEGSQFCGLAQFDAVNGGAVNLVDCGLSCKKSSFKKCLSKSGNGGAIYIKSACNHNSKVYLEEVTVDECKAGYGGAVYLYNNFVSIKKCNFSMNEALFENSEFGGGAVFVAVRKGSITDCTFSENRGEGGSLHINNDFEINGLFMEENSVEIDRCTFKIQKDSKCSLFYVAGNGKSSFVLNNCIFTGKLANNAHYIDGKSISKEAQKLLIRSCKFSYDSMSSLNLDPNNEFLTVDLNNQFLNYDNANNEKLKTWEIIVAIVVPAVTVILIAAIVMVIIKKKYFNNNIKVGDSEIAENLQNNDINALKQTLI